MSDGLAFHGPWCNTHTYPLRCRYCGEPIFYFTCDHGSRVLFDSLGPPWPLHRCIEYGIATYGEDTVGDIMAYGMMSPGYSRHGLQVQREYIEKVRRQSDADKARPRETAPMSPVPNAVYQAAGHVREITINVNIHKRAGVDPDNRMANAFLGELAAQSMAQITIEVDDLSLDDKETRKATRAMYPRTCSSPWV